MSTNTEHRPIFQSRSLEELLNEPPEKKPRHPNVKYNSENLTIEITAKYFYEVDLEGIRDSAELMDWYWHLQEKGWFTIEMWAAFVSELEDACFDAMGQAARGLFCHSGEKVKWPTVKQMELRRKVEA
jgi:hypothetical protein